MKVTENWTEDRANEVFNTLKLNKSEGMPPMVLPGNVVIQTGKDIVFTRLSDNSTPPPHGRIMNANLEESYR